jgi:formylmethanofuran dehydrogenase subunit E
MVKEKDGGLEMPDDLALCVAFHGHICPGLIYGYRVAKEALRLLGVQRARDEEIVAVCENDSCAVDALQVLLGTALGKGNLIIKDYGKNAYTVLSRRKRVSYRFSRQRRYEYEGMGQEEYRRLDAAVQSGTASETQRAALRRLKIDDLLARPFSDIFATEEVPFEEPPYAPIKPSEPCAVCGEMTMVTKMRITGDGRLCIPCSQKR